MAIILFLNLKGGVAKTTNAIAVAEALADEGRKVLVVDADHQCTAGEVLLGRKRLDACEQRKATLHDLLASMLDAEFSPDAIASYIEYGCSDIRGTLPDLAILPCSIRIDDFSTNMARARRGYRSTDEFLSIYLKRRRMLRAWLAENFDDVIVDCPPAISLQVRVLLSVADTFIVPSIPDSLSVRGCRSLLERVKRTNIKVPALGTLWSLYRSRNPVHRDIVASAWKGGPEYDFLPRPFKTIIPNAAAVARAFETRNPPPSFAAKYSPEVAKRYRLLCLEIKRRLKKC